MKWLSLSNKASSVDSIVLLIVKWQQACFLLKKECSTKHFPYENDFLFIRCSLGKFWMFSWLGAWSVQASEWWKLRNTCYWRSTLLLEIQQFLKKTAFTCAQSQIMLVSLLIDAKLGYNFVIARSFWSYTHVEILIHWGLIINCCTHNCNHFSHVSSFTTRSSASCLGPH